MQIKTFLHFLHINEELQQDVANHRDLPEIFDLPSDRVDDNSVAVNEVLIQTALQLDELTNILLEVNKLCVVRIGEHLWLRLNGWELRAGEDGTIHMQRLTEDDRLSSLGTWRMLLEWDFS